MSNYLYMDGEKIGGPVDLSELRSLLATGKISEGTQVALKGGSWKPLAEVLKPSKARKIIMIALLLVGLLTIAAIGIADKRSDPETYRQLAASQAEQYLKLLLKAPATATISPDYVINKGWTYTVQGKVDAQNEFGSMLRKNYRVELELDIATGKWSLVTAPDIY